MSQLRPLRRAARFGVEAARAVVTLLVIEVCLRTGGVDTACARLGLRSDLTSARQPRAGHVVLPRRTKTPVRACCAVASAWPAGDTCLRRCLLLGHRLRQLDPVLRIGVRREDAVFAAHAWLEIDGVALDPASAGYAALGTANGAPS
ncbi:lasso peptide biosynthesis B2 protein [Haloechinothrix halophila]|uniref:lasso peptide biosynthesis B2 protein n=1 Tax=Haloechinothrix halophila TaxID=1069073 RepID=UPI0003FEA74A|nr:lasso peptide biosynthesis B2 protein [Haloechinothrix halophila]